MKHILWLFCSLSFAQTSVVGYNVAGTVIAQPSPQWLQVHPTAPVWNDFNTANLTGQPTVTFVNAFPSAPCTYSCSGSCTAKNQMGFQGGVFLPSLPVVLYPPWGVCPGNIETSGTGFACCAVHGNLLTYWPNVGPFNSNSSNQWLNHDMTTDTNPNTSVAFNNGGNCGPGQKSNPCPQNYVYATTVTGANCPTLYCVYLSPGAQNAGRQVFAKLGVTATFNTWTWNYVLNGTCGTGCNGLGTTGNGWAASVWPGGNFIFYFATTTNTRHYKHNISGDGSGFSSSSWNVIDVTTCTAANSPPDGLQDTNVQGTLSAASDGHQFIYTAPASNDSTIEEMDYTTGASWSTCSGTWFGFNMKNMGTSGHPSMQTDGTITNANLHDFGSALMVTTNGDLQNGTEYFYIAGFSESAGLFGYPAVACRVPVGSYSSGAWTRNDPFASTTTSWQCRDVNAFLTNPLWMNASELTIASYLRGGNPYSSLAGWQLGWITNSNKVCFSDANASYYLCHDPNHSLFDNAGWTIFPEDPNSSPNNNFGGPFDIVNGIFYPAILTTANGTSVTLSQGSTLP